MRDDASEILGAASRGGILFTCEHASNRVPRPWRLRPSDRALLATHWGYDIGARELTAELVRLSGGTGVLSRFSRLLIDPNRAPDDPTAILRECDDGAPSFNRWCGASAKVGGVEAGAEARFGAAGGPWGDVGEAGAGLRFGAMDGGAMDGGAGRDGVATGAGGPGGGVEAVPGLRFAGRVHAGGGVYTSRRADAHDEALHAVSLRVRRFHAPFHDTLDRTVRLRRPRFLCSVHTFTPVFRDKARPMEAGVLFDRHDDLAEDLLRALRAQGVRAEANEPYSGKAGLIYSANRHGTRHGVPYLEIEVRQDLVASALDARRVARRVWRALSAMDV